MQFSLLALTAFVASAAAHYNGTVTYTTEVVTQYVTYCPVATELTHGGVTYTASASETLTITNCPCTIVKPVTTSSVVICSTCAPSAAPPVYTNGTGPTSTAAPIIGTITLAPLPTSTPSTTPILEANSGNKAIAFSGASLAGVLAFAAYFL